jgi:hypothetical protein
MIIIASKCGQLGNRLFQFAHFIAFSAQCGVTIWNPGFEEYADSFEGTYRSAVSRYPFSANGLGLLLRSRAVIYRVAHMAALYIKTRNPRTDRLRTLLLSGDEEFRLDDTAFEASMQRKQLLFVHGYEFRARSYFARHGEAIRKFFTPRQKHLLRVDAVLTKAREKSDVVVGIHIRRGDYRKFLDGRYFFELSDYLKMMRATQDLFTGKRVCFLVCSNEELNAVDFSSFNVTFGTGHQVEDLYAFARCDYLLGPPSSYTLWAGFYGECPIYFMWNQTAFPRALADFQVPSEEKRLIF